MAERMREMCTSMRAVEGVEFLALDEIEEAFPVEDAAGVLGESDEQVELVARQDLRLAVDPHVAGAEVDLQATEAQRGPLLLDHPPLPPQDRPQPRQEFARVEGLGQVVVGPDLQPDDAVGVVAARRSASGSGPASAMRSRRQTSKPSMSGQHHVEDDGVEAAFGERLEAGGPQGTGVDGEAGRREILRHHGGQARVVVDDENALAHLRPRAGSPLVRAAALAGLLVRPVSHAAVHRFMIVHPPAVRAAPALPHLMTLASWPARGRRACPAARVSAGRRRRGRRRRSSWTWRRTWPPVRRAALRPRRDRP